MPVPRRRSPASSMRSLTSSLISASRSAISRACSCVSFVLFVMSVLLWARGLLGLDARVGEEPGRRERRLDDRGRRGAAEPRLPREQVALAVPDEEHDRGLAVLDAGARETDRAAPVQTAPLVLRPLVRLPRP